MTSSNKMLVSTLYGQQLLVNPDDEIGGTIIRKGIYDKPYVYLLNKILKNIKQAIVFDIGANIGNHAISISQQCESIYAFEPDSETNLNLNKNIQLNNINNIYTYKVGLSDNECTSDFYVNISGNTGASTLHPSDDITQYKKCQIKLTTGDNFISNNAIKKIDLIKIDIEGHEIQALEGMKESIKLFKPIILLEWTADNTISSSDTNEFFNEIRQTYAGYTALSSLNKSLWPSSFIGKTRRFIHKLSKQEKWTLTPADLSKKHTNIFLVHPDKLNLISHLVHGDASK